MNVRNVKQAELFLQEMKEIMTRYKIKGIAGLVLIDDGFMPFQYAPPGLLLPLQLDMYNSTYRAICKACDNFGPPTYLTP